MSSRLAQTPSEDPTSSAPAPRFEPTSRLVHHPVSVAATCRALCRSGQLRRAPLRTVRRGVSWLARCATGRDAVVRLRRWDCRLLLPSGMRLGTTAVYLYRDHYEPELAHLEDFVPEGSTVIDVGANLGLYTVVAAKLVGPRGRVIAVEPSAATFELLRHNVALNGLGNVTLVNKALSDGVGAARLYHIAGAPNYSLGAPADPGTAYEDVETVSLDRLVTDCGAADVSCVKIDVEGAEHLVVRGGTGCLARWRPAVIFEVNDENAGRFGSSGTDTVAALRELGYRFEVAAGDCLVPLSGPPGTGNVVARHGTRARGV